MLFRSLVKHPVAWRRPEPLLSNMLQQTFEILHVQSRRGAFNLWIDEWHQKRPRRFQTTIEVNSRDQAFKSSGQDRRRKMTAVVQSFAVIVRRTALGNSLRRAGPD